MYFAKHFRCNAILPLLTFCVFYALCCCVLGSTQADKTRSLLLGDNKILKGAYLGNLDLVREGVMNDGDVNVVMTRFIGEEMLKFGKAEKDFPLAPALHIAVSQGTRPHLNIAFYLLKLGALPNVFGKSFYPAILYGFGFFSPPSSSHAALAQRLINNFPSHFNARQLLPWRRATSSPPLLHLLVMRGYYDGVYVISTSSGFPIDETDDSGLTALMVAAWLGNINLVELLLHRGADMSFVDCKRRNALHYMAVRGFDTLLRSVLLHNNNSTAQEKLRLIRAKDAFGVSAIQLAEVYPHCRDVIERFLLTHDLSSSYSARRWQIPNFADSDMQLIHREFAMQRPFLIREAFNKSIASLLSELRLIDTEEALVRLINNNTCHASDDAVVLTPSPHHLSLPLRLLHQPKGLRVCFGDSNPLAIRAVGHSGTTVSGIRSGSATWIRLASDSNNISREWILIPPAVAINVSSAQRSLSSQAFYDDVALELLRRKVAMSVVQHLDDVLVVPHSWAYVSRSTTQAATMSIEQSVCFKDEKGLTFTQQISIADRIYGSHTKDDD